MKGTIINYAIIFALSLLALNVWMYWQQSKMIFYPMRDINQTPADWGLAYEDITFNTADDILLHGWYIPHKQSEYVLLFFHGNAGNISYRRDSIEIFHRLGLNVFIVDYRGYGKSQGKPDEQGLYLDASAAWRFLTEEKGFAASQILIFGRSLGGAVATQQASGVQARGLILESTFSSAKDFARSVFPLLSRLLFMRYDFNTAERIQRVNYPVLVLHSPDDEIMPFQLGEKVYLSANQPKRFVKMKGDHNSGFILSQPGYEQALADWMKSLKQDFEP
ncbi:MAG: alpha/beta hydrolase [Gammaproteobacteria bacterium]|nr:MAG: alpha/beta hydrolase [Gammaproteobacteria bacterium]